MGAKNKCDPPCEAAWSGFLRLTRGTDCLAGAGGLGWVEGSKDPWVLATLLVGKLGVERNGGRNTESSPDKSCETI